MLGGYEDCSDPALLVGRAATVNLVALDLGADRVMGPLLQIPDRDRAVVSNHADARSSSSGPDGSNDDRIVFKRLLDCNL